MNTKAGCPPNADSGITIRSFRETDLNFVISRQLTLYASEYGFTSDIWKTYLTCGVQDFIRQFDRERDCMYILENNTVPCGCIAITSVGDDTAQLRFYFIEPEMRGKGAGHRLIDLALYFCKEKEYRHVFLWTFSTLLAARHLYADRRFRITDTHVNNEWGDPVLEERWELEL